MVTSASLGHLFVIVWSFICRCLGQLFASFPAPLAAVLGHTLVILIIFDVCCVFCFFVFVKQGRRDRFRPSSVNTELRLQIAHCASQRRVGKSAAGCFETYPPSLHHQAHYTRGAWDRATRLY
jgi:hypothetical protein